MNPKLIKLVAVLAVLCTLAGCGALFTKDMTGMPYADIAAYMEAHPRKTVTYTVTVAGGAEPLLLNESTTDVTLTAADQVYGIIDQGEYLQAVTAIDLAFEPTEQHLLALLPVFPNADITYDSFTVDGVSYPADTDKLDLSDYCKDTDKTIALLQAMPQVKTVELMDEDGNCAISLEDVLALQEACPDVLLHYSFKLFGKTLTTDMEELIYENVKIGDSGLDEFRRIMPIMKNLTTLRLDTCDTSNEATAQLRDDLKEQCKVTWRVFFGQNNCLTDTYKIWATWNLNEDEVEVLKYCTEAKYIDLGHNDFRNVDFMAYMPDIEMAIIAMAHLNDIDGIQDCTKLEYLEIFTNVDLTNEHMQLLSGLTNIKYLNISNIPQMTDLSFTDNMKDLRKLWCVMSRVDQEEIDRVQALHPDCEIVYKRIYGDPTDYGWRYVPGTNEEELSPEYALVRARFGYDTWDLSQGSRGYLREEITYEDLGLEPS